HRQVEGRHGRGDDAQGRPLLRDPQGRMEVTAGPAGRASQPPPAAVPPRSPHGGPDRRQLLCGLAVLPLVMPTSPAMAAARAEGAADPTALVLAPGLTLLFHEAGETGVVAFES